ncbi:murinoglobulin-1 isoform X3 [Orussus abietinus]|uniref:murinoglobulin-1 isoform X3 n=1 Tax=Orussus abietinus TaxID=222816 RepID=UPI000626DB71|nr:murinoglobulin-1 isoform X3 [Orussus abietinus]
MPAASLRSRNLPCRRPEGCIELLVPSTKYSTARLRLNIKFSKHPDYVVNAEKEVGIEHDSLVTFVETDKPIYKPGQDVNIRILSLKHDLKPWKKPIPKVWIENPTEVRVAQWANVTTNLGMVDLLLPLSPEPSLGTWKIKVEKKKSHHQLIDTATFEVKKYVLPRFQLTISSPGYILADAGNVTWHICAKYSYGQPVKGSLLLKTMSQTPSWRRKKNLPEINYETKLNSPDGCTDFTVSGNELGLAHWKVAPNNIILTANFTEAGTGIVETTSSRTVVVHQTLKLEFAPYTPKYFKLGLPYHGKLRVLRQDDTPAPNEKIQLCLRVRGKDEWLRVVVECRNFTSSPDGFVDFLVPPQHKNIVLLSFVATGIEYPTKYYSPDKRWRVFMDQPSAYFDANPWYSPSDSYLAVARGYQPIVCGERYSFNVMYSVPVNNDTNRTISFHYSINSKGDLLIFGHVKHRPHRESVLNYSEFRNLLGAVDTPTNKTEQNHVVHRFPLSVKVTPSMAPVSELLLYYVRPDGETVATTYTIEVGHCFENKVKTAWHDESQSPGSATQFHVEASPWSICGVSVVDKSTRFLGGSKTGLVDADLVFNQLKAFHLAPETRPIQEAWNHCKKTAEPEASVEEIDHLPRPAVEEPPVWDQRRKKRTTFLSTHVNYVDAIQAFDDFGAIVISDLILESRPCPSISFLPHGPRISLNNMMIRELDEPDRLLKTVNALPLAFPLLNFQVPGLQGPSVNAGLGYVEQPPDQATILRSYFPETWLWETVQTGKEGKATLERSLPHTITDWIGHTVCISPKHGLGISPPTSITAFQPFFLDYSLPYSVKRGEILRMKVSLFNYMQHSLPVKIKLEDAKGLELQKSSDAASYCVKSRDSVVHEYALKSKDLGEINITVSAAIDPDYAEPCGPETLVYTRDEIVKPILVQPEGFPVELTKSAFVCPKDFSDDSMISWVLELPKDLVPDSARGYVSFIGDILGPALENLSNLVRLPMGCGEQNMILFVPNIHVIGYLDASGMQNDALRARAVKNMEKGYQRELNYRHPDGSYSAFGPDSSMSGGSMWLTAFVVKSLAQARSIIHIDERDLKFSVKWITRRQLENGCFPLIGKVFHKDMKGGLQDEETSSPALTAYVLISLLESGVPLSASLINNALYCLEKGMESDSENPYTPALSTYALALLEHPKAKINLQSLMARATRHNNLLWWEDKVKPSMGLSIEMTAYAVLSLVKLGGEDNMVEALKAVRWMSKQRNAEGGFTSTQDTVLGLEALSKYAVAMSTKTTDLSVLVTAGDVDRVFKVENEDRLVLNQIKLPVLPTVVEVFAEGEGCLLVQSNLKYNVAHATGSQAFELSVTAESVALVDECSMQKITVCGRYKLADEESNMALLEIGMISGYVPDRSSLHGLLEDPSTQVKRFEDEKGAVTIYFDKLTAQRKCISFIVNRENVVERPEPANVKLYDYYQQELTVTTSYNFKESCRSAEEVEEHDPIPNPMPVEPDPNKPAMGKTINDRIMERSFKGSGKDGASSKNKLAASITDKPEVKTVPPARVTELIEKLRERIAAKTKSEKSEASTSRTDTPLDVASKPTDPNLDGADPLPGAILHDDSGSGQQPEGPETGLNPTFVEIDHDLEVPEGVEGPPPVFVKPTDEFVQVDEDDVQSPSKIRHEKGRFKEHSEVAAARNESPRTVSKDATCPWCADVPPANANETFCAATSAVKVAVRRWRKVRLLLDMKAPRQPKRLRSTVQLKLDADCSCQPLDSPGTFALLLDSEGVNWTAVEEHSQLTVGKSMSVYTLPNVEGLLPQFAGARAACPSGLNESIDKEGRQ